ncbi:PREDICTED: tubulin delta chain-like [Dufourea novaeangliae]|uniref:tubulin delta chain-like n=1 Tax=Dufourea novaeangliae TaxID=178035 RepID=UPI0007674622|nr:PREDICTED: tubulin delta chain-like [Dufourea novaeangliae]
MLTLQFGQCGNQLGHALFSKISADLECANTGVPHNINYQYSEDTFNKWFNGISKEGKHLARAILVDTEQKVIKKMWNNTTIPWMYWTKNVICQSGGGCANNWAYGYMIKGHELKDEILNSVRQEIERMDHFDGFLLLLSSSGGTGSGIGSYIAKLLREEYKSKPIITTTILPFSFGEVSTQNYNTLFTLAKLYNQSDMNIIIENDQIHDICKTLLKKFTTSLQDMNEIISEKLLAILQPINSIKHSINSLVSQIASHPCYKLATIKSTPHISTMSLKYEPIYNWSSYTHHLKQTLRISNSDSKLTNVELKLPSNLLSTTTHHVYTCSVSNLLVTRGTTTDNNLVVPNEFKDKHLYTDWNTTDCFSHLHQERKFLNYDKFLGLITNNSQISYPLDILLNKTWNSYIHAAFLHQYKRFGLEEDDFLQAFSVIENVVKEYKELT